jgi:hypothetical protein
LAISIDIIGAAETQKSKNYVPGFPVFFSCMLPMGIGKNETILSRKEKSPHGQ